MIKSYDYRHEDLQTKYSAIHQEVDEQINKAAQALLDVVNVPSFQIDLGLDSLFVGDRDPSLGRCPLLDAIHIREYGVFIRVEPNDGFYLLTDFETLHIPDKLKILSVVEGQLREFL